MRVLDQRDDGGVALVAGAVDLVGVILADHVLVGRDLGDLTGRDLQSGPGIEGDPESDIFAGESDSLPSLFLPGSMPRLSRLRLHEAGGDETRSALARWDGFARLESLDLSDFGFGSLVPRQFLPSRPCSRLRRLAGVKLMSDEDAELFLSQIEAARLVRLRISFCDEDDSQGGDGLAPSVAERVIRDARLSLLAELKRRKRSQALLDLITSWESEDGPIDQEHLDWADAVLDRQGVER